MRVWLNGRLVATEKARISPFDRGFLFGDGVYEVVRFFGGAGFGLDEHVVRLGRSLAMSKITGFDPAELTAISQALLADADLQNAIVYLQVTRGDEGCRHHVPHEPLKPTVFACATPAQPLEEMVRPQIVSCVSLPDERWRLCSIKTVSLMGNVLASLKASEANAEEAILHRGGFVSEGSRTNVFAVLAGLLVTPQIDSEPPILHGVTRGMVVTAAKAAGMRMEVRPLRVEELKKADEVFLTSTTRLISCVSHLDRAPIRREGVGPITQMLFDVMRNKIAEMSGAPIHSMQ